MSNDVIYGFENFGREIVPKAGFAFLLVIDSCREIFFGLRMK
jgi:hypothetical protein